jgi:hypothetical protein
MKSIITYHKNKYFIKNPRRRWYTSKKKTNLKEKVFG